MSKVLLFTGILCCCLSAMAQQPGAPIDVLHYDFGIQLSDSSDMIIGRASIQFKSLKTSSSVSFDLIPVSGNGRGMQVMSVTDGRDVLSFEQENKKLNIKLKLPLTAGAVGLVVIQYKGIPADGLIIAKNKFGHRGFFADNWPNRASNWIPCVDHPADKASVDFEVRAPLHYQVVANGVQVEESVVDSQYRLTHYRETVPVAPKVMVIGVADFAVQYAGDVNCIPVYSWVYPENKDQGFHDYAQAMEILPFYINHIGPYGYKKLANVQSKTRFGGLENANTIFYSEASVTGTRRSEALMAHEIAHQWFGNMATETDWAHLWLSEGFATYMTILYMENKYGKDTAIKMLEQDRKEVIKFSKQSDRTVVDSSVTDYMQLLNENSYQKGGWILHMLRQETGDAIFWKCLQTYYARYAGKNASTEDLEHVFAEVSGKDFRIFFRQWLYTPGQPNLDINWNYDTVKNKLSINVIQLQPQLFVFPLDLRIHLPGSTAVVNKTVTIQAKTSSFEWILPSSPLSVEVDPDTRLLFERK